MNEPKFEIVTIPDDRLDDYVSPHIKNRMVACPCCHRAVINIPLIERIEAVREQANIAWKAMFEEDGDEVEINLIVDKWGMCGGEADIDSPGHIVENGAIAVDFHLEVINKKTGNVIHRIPTYQVYALIENFACFNSIGAYPDHIHVAQSKEYNRWISNGELALDMRSISK